MLFDLDLIWPQGELQAVLKHVTKITTEQNLRLAPKIVCACTVGKGNLVFNLDPICQQGGATVAIETF